MKQLYPIFILFLILLCSHDTCQAQNSRRRVVMVIIDSTTNNPIENAIVSFTRRNEKEVLRYGLSNKNGIVEIIEIDSGHYECRIEHLSYNPKIKKFHIVRRVTDAGLVQLAERSAEIDAIVVNSLRPIESSNDSTVYNVKFFNPAPHEFLEDLVRKLPGLEIKDGRLYFKGRYISNLTVEGKQFFSSNQSIALQNLPAYAIDKISIHKKKRHHDVMLTDSELENRELEVDITLKEKMKTGWIGNLTGGTNFFEKYSAKILMGKFGRKKQYAVIADANNLSSIMQSTSTYDNVQRQMTNSVFRYSPQSVGSPGEVRSIATGIDYSNESKNKSDVSSRLNTNYSYKRTEGDILSGYKRETYTPDATIFSSRSSSGYDLVDKHSLTLFKDLYDPKKPISHLDFNPYFSYSRRENYGKNDYATYINDPSNMKNKGESHDRNSSNTREAKGSIASLIRLNKSKRMMLSVKINYAYTGTDSKSNYYSSTLLTSGATLKDSVINQLAKETSRQCVLEPSLTLITKPLKKLNVFFNYSLNMDESVVDRKVYDYNIVNQEYDDYDEESSGKIKSQLFQQNIGLNINPRIFRVNVEIGMQAKPSVTKYEFNNIKVEQKCVDYFPLMNISYNKLQDHKIFINYRGETKQPSIDQLYPITDKKNPINIVIGNLNLRPEFNHNLSINYSRLNGFILKLNANLTRNKIISKSNIDNNGIKTMMPINENGSYNAAIEFSYLNMTPTLSKFWVTNTLSCKYNHGVGYSNATKYFSKSIIASENITFFLRTNYFYSRLNLNANYSNSYYTLNKLDRKSVWNNSATWNINWSLPLDIKIESNLNYNFYIGYKFDNKPSVIWNLELAKLILKKRVSISIKGTDILNQTKNMKYITGEDYIEEQHNNVIKRYIMFNILYRFGKF